MERDFLVVSYSRELFWGSPPHFYRILEHIRSENQWHEEMVKFA